MGPLNGDVTYGRAARAGFNFWRFSPNNFSIKVFADPADANRATLDHVRWEQAQMVDEMLLMTRKYGLCNFYGIFGYTKVFNDQPDDREGMDKVKRIIKYSVDRWGAYVDFWEFLNEQHADARWYEIVIPYLESIDPYDHPIATSWERPELAGIEVNAPHWYGNEPELVSDRVTADRARHTKQFGKPVVYGEQGNYRGREDRSAKAWAALGSRQRPADAGAMLDGHVQRDQLHLLGDVVRQGRPRAKHLDRSPGTAVHPRRCRTLPRCWIATCVWSRFRCPARRPLTSARTVSAPIGARPRTSIITHVSSAGRKPARTARRAIRGATIEDRSTVWQVTIDVPTSSTGYWYRPTDGAIAGCVRSGSGPANGYRSALLHRSGPLVARTSSRRDLDWGLRFVGVPEHCTSRCVVVQWFLGELHPATGRPCSYPVPAPPKKRYHSPLCLQVCVVSQRSNRSGIPAKRHAYNPNQEDCHALSQHTPTC